MKIKHLLTKTLLVAAGLLVGQSVWAENLSAPVKMTYINGSDANVDVSYGEVTTAYCGYNKISGGKVEMANKGWGVNNIAYLQVDASAVPAGATITAASLEVDCQQISARGLGYGVGYNSSAWSSTMTWNTADRSITTMGAVIWGSKETTDKHNTFDITDAFSGDADNIVTILVYQTAAGAGYVTNPTATITYTTETAYNVTFTETNGVAATVKIGEKDVTSGTKLANGTYDFTATAAGYQNYAGSFTVSGADKEVTFTMTAKPRYTFTVNAMNKANSAIIQPLFTDDDSYEGKTYTVYFPAYLTTTGNVVTYSKDNSTFYTNYTSAPAEATKTVSYNAYVGDAWFFEGEDVTGATVYTTATFAGRSSNGKTGVLSEKTVTSLDAGAYRITARSIGKNGNTHSLYKGSVSGEKIMDITTSTSGAIVSSVITLDATTDIVANGGYYTTSDNGHGFDYFLIEKVIPVEIPSSGFATISSAYPIDCDNLPAGVTAYKVTKMTASEVTATEVTGQVAAGTGLILKADAAETYDIPVANAGTAVEDNKLKAAVTATAVAADEAYGLKDGKFHKLKAGTISAGKAYLLASDITSAPDAPELTIVFGGATGISEIKTMRNAENEIFFDLQGRKVAQPAKGLYIQNGRKVILK